jgi:hypothetical protein
MSNKYCFVADIDGIFSADAPCGIFVIFRRCILSKVTNETAALYRGGKK